MKIGNLIFLILSLGTLSLAGYILFLRYQPNKLSFTNVSQTTKSGFTNNKPVGLIITAIHVELPVSETEVTKGNWPTSSHAILHVNSSPLPGDFGNAILYGHNWPSLLGNLVKIHNNDLISVLFNNGEVRIFKVDSLKSVSPNNSEVLNSTESKVLTLYTCTGLFDQDRFVVRASYQGTILASKN